MEEKKSPLFRWLRVVWVDCCEGQKCRENTESSGHFLHLTPSVWQKLGEALDDWKRHFLPHLHLQSAILIVKFNSHLKGFHSHCPLKDTLHFGLQFTFLSLIREAALLNV